MLPEDVIIDKQDSSNSTEGVGEITLHFHLLTAFNQYKKPLLKNCLEEGTIKSNIVHVSALDTGQHLIINSIKAIVVKVNHP